MKPWLFITISAVFLCAVNAAWAIGVEETVAPDPDDKPLQLQIWYPSAPGDDSQVAGSGLPLIVISHGTGGSRMGHWDTAVALAEAGFVVASPDHTGDNWKDESYVAKGQHLIGRSRHIARVIDFMLDSWRGHDRIDAARIGLFGHSAGGFTGLVVAGGEPDLTQGMARCRARPSMWECVYLHEHGFTFGDVPMPIPASLWDHDQRVKALVIAAPAVGWAFEPNGLASVTIPIQLWQAQMDRFVDDSPDRIRRLLPAPPDYYLVPNAGHLSFLAPCGWKMSLTATVAGWFSGLNICADPKGFDRAAFHQEFNAAVVRFFSEKLPAP